MHYDGNDFGSVATVILKTGLKVTVDLQRPNFMTFFFFAHNIAKTSI